MYIMIREKCMYCIKLKSNVIVIKTRYSVITRPQTHWNKKNLQSGLQSLSQSLETEIYLVLNNGLKMLEHPITYPEVLILHWLHSFSPIIDPSNS